MSSFAVDTMIDAPVTAVWQTLADIGEIHRWNPGVKASHLTTEQGEGTGRYGSIASWLKTLRGKWR